MFVWMMAVDHPAGGVSAPAVRVAATATSRRPDAGTAAKVAENEPAVPPPIADCATDGVQSVALTCGVSVLSQFW